MGPDPSLVTEPFYFDAYRLFTAVVVTLNSFGIAAILLLKLRIYREVSTNQQLQLAQSEKQERILQDVHDLLTVMEMYARGAERTAGVADKQITVVDKQTELACRQTELAATAMTKNPADSGHNLPVVKIGPDGKPYGRRGTDHLPCEFVEPNKPGDAK